MHNCPDPVSYCNHRGTSEGRLDCCLYIFVSVWIDISRCLINAQYLKRKKHQYDMYIYVDICQ